MNSFIQKHNHLVTHCLSGFDRLVIRGTLRNLSYVDGMLIYLSFAKVLLKDFKKHVLEMSQILRQASLAVVLAAGRPVKYLSSSKGVKENLAKEIMQSDNITRGPICTFTCVEPCYSYIIIGNREKQMLELKPKVRKCLFLYHYFIHPEFGFMHARIQTWFPFPIQICINGREWLSRQMDKANLSYQRKDNAFVALEEPEKAQQFMDEQPKASWADLLDPIAKRVNPAHNEMFHDFSTSYYWSVQQSEWATDLLFKNSNALQSLYPHLIHHGLVSFSSPDVMRFLGKHVPLHGNVHRKFKGEIVSDFKERQEGVRVKHRLGKNSIKMYDKHGIILRTECTINNTSGFLVYRTTEKDENAKPRWLPLRKGIADIRRRTQLSDKANERYLDALAQVECNKSLEKLCASICSHTTFKGQRVRALHPLEPRDYSFLKAIGSGEFCIQGFRNKDLRHKIFGYTADKNLDKKYSAMVTRHLRLLRAHGLIRKIPRTHRYLVTTKGREIIMTILAAGSVGCKKLTELAAA